MQYPGGKSRIKKYLAPIVQSAIDKTQSRTYIEPFCGMCSIACSVRVDHKVLYDSNPEVIALWKALQAGWDPPEIVTEEEYRRIKNDLGAPAHLRAFVGFGCSFAGKLWGGLRMDLVVSPPPPLTFNL